LQRKGPGDPLRGGSATLFAKRSVAKATPLRSAYRKSGGLPPARQSPSLRFRLRFPTLRIAFSPEGTDRLPPLKTAFMQFMDWVLRTLSIKLQQATKEFLWVTEHWLSFTVRGPT